MKNLLITIALAMTVMLTGCIESDLPSAKEIQSRKSEAAANSLSFTSNAEIDNIKRRLELTADPGLLGFVVLLNDMGQPVMYTGVKGKITSGGKRLTRQDEIECIGNGCYTRASSSDEGTFGSSNPYIYFWTMEGQYVQWSGNYLYSDKPFRLSAPPLVVTVK